MEEQKTQIRLVQYDQEVRQATDLIMGFWKAHSQYDQSFEEANQDLAHWTAPGHAFYFIVKDGETVGFVHLGNRGASIDWLEDLFVLPDFQNQGIGTKAVELVETMVREYSDSLYIEAAARNEAAIRLYRRLGFNCLNTISMRKDFHEDDFDVIRTETVYDCEFQIRKRK